MGGADYTTLPIHLEVGKRYHRLHEIHGVLGGQRQGGMSTPAVYPIILLFTGAGGEEHGYRDEFREDGTFWYTGEGQRGDMDFVRANRALRFHHRDAKRVHLFESLGGGIVGYVGEVEYLGYHWEERPDTEGSRRRAIVFELGLIIVDSVSPDQVREMPGVLGSRSKSLLDLRERALKTVPCRADPVVRRRNVQVRAEAVRRYVLKRADGQCEGCGRPAPFRTRRGKPYLEPHHTTRLADGGPDHPDHVIALCPNCHRRVHHGQDGEAYNSRLIERLGRVGVGH